MEIIHVSGTICSGKSYVIDQFKSRTDIAIWDILNYYTDNNVIVNGVMDWSKYDAASEGIVPNLEAFFIATFKNKHCFIESGSNTKVNKYLRKVNKKYHVHQIQLKTPSIDVIKSRAEMRGEIAVELALNFRKMFLERHAHSTIKSYTQQEAIDYIASILGGSNVLEQTTASKSCQDS